jgi:threonine aldolase
MGEAVVFFERELAAGFAERCKQAGQVGSKPRFVAASWLAMLENGTWLRHAAQANAMARKLHDELFGLAGVKVLFPVETNAVFAQFPGGTLAAVRELGWSVPGIFGDDSCRLMCGWNTSPDDVRAFVDGVRAVLARR